MTYLRPHNRDAGARLYRLIAGVGFVVAALFALTSWQAPGFFPGLMTSFARPFWRVEFSVGSGALRSAEALLAENETLKRRIAELEFAMSSSTAEFLLEENAGLKALLDRASTTPRRVAAVLSRPPVTPYDELIIDLGRNDGVSSSTLVYASGDVLIGRVTGVFSRVSSVRLFSSPREKHDVLIGSANIPAVAIGRGGGFYQAEVPHGSGIQTGDIVKNPSLNDREFGIVASIGSDPSSPFDTVLFAPPVNISGLRWVLLEKYQSI